MRKDFDFPTQAGVVARTGTPKNALDKLSTSLLSALEVSDVKAVAEKFAYDISPGTQQELAALMREDLAKYRSIVEARGIKLEN